MAGTGSVTLHPEVDAAFAMLNAKRREHFASRRAARAAMLAAKTPAERDAAQQEYDEQTAHLSGIALMATAISHTRDDGG